MYENIQPHNCNPPGTFTAPVSHPNGSDRTIEKAVIMEHRFAFFFWMKWHNQLAEKRDLKKPPTLLTIDWHRDLAPPPNEQKKQLQELDQSNLSDVANYIWAQFEQTNDGHILCTAWLNLIGDIILLKNSAETMQDTFVDKDGDEHTIYEFRYYNEFEEFMLQREYEHYFFDVDLDYFIHGKGSRHYSEDFERYSDDEICSVVNSQSPAFQHFLPKVEGLTIAQEPGYCGGILNSCHIMNVFHEQLFDDHDSWKHLSH